jgi:alkylhydroperoxidase family enzyme
MPLVEPLPVEALDEDLLRRSRIFVDGPLGLIPNSVRTMARQPSLATAFVELSRAVMHSAGRVPLELKRLIGYMSSLAAGCRYCQAHNALNADALGCPEERLGDLWTYATSPHFTDAEKVAFDFALAAASVPMTITTDLEKRLRRHWDDQQIVEIVSVVALFGFLNRWNDAMGTTLEGPASTLAAERLARQGWDSGKHGG